MYFLKPTTTWIGYPARSIGRLWFIHFLDFKPKFSIFYPSICSSPVKQTFEVRGINFGRWCVFWRTPNPV